MRDNRVEFVDDLEARAAMDRESALKDRCEAEHLRDGRCSDPATTRGLIVSAETGMLTINAKMCEAHRLAFRMIVPKNFSPAPQPEVVK